MSFNLDAPTYIGGAPSDFAITRVTLNGETYDTNSFAIDTNTGSISLSNTSELPVGLYTLSVSCYSNGNYYEFKDIVTINMMKPVPDSISVEPNKISAEFADIISTESTVELLLKVIISLFRNISLPMYVKTEYWLRRMISSLFPVQVRFLLSKVNLKFNRANMYLI